MTEAEQARLAALDDSERSDAELRNRSLTYVAAIRARDELTVVQRGEAHPDSGSTIVRADGHIGVMDVAIGRGARAVVQARRGRTGDRR